MRRPITPTGDSNPQPPNQFIGVLWQLCNYTRYEMVDFKHPAVQINELGTSDNHSYEIRATPGIELNPTIVTILLRQVFATDNWQKTIQVHKGTQRIGDLPGEGYMEWLVPVEKGHLLVRRYFLVG